MDLPGSVSIRGIEAGFPAPIAWAAGSGRPSESEGDSPERPPSRSGCGCACRRGCACRHSPDRLPASGRHGCGPSGYAYAGIQSAQASYGIGTVLTALATPAVRSGHVAGWVGVGGPGQGPGGSDEWLQVGLNGFPGRGNTLYYEVTRPGDRRTYGEIATAVPSGRPVPGCRARDRCGSGVWRVWVNGRAVGRPIALPMSHGRLSPMAIAESWDGGRSACNRCRYRFNRVSLAGTPGGDWYPARDAIVLQDRGYRVIRRTPASFDAAAVGTGDVARRRLVSLRSA